jgi:hypothetical protein
LGYGARRDAAVRDQPLVFQQEIKPKNSDHPVSQRNQSIDDPVKSEDVD